MNSSLGFRKTILNSRVQTTVELNSKYPNLVHKFFRVKSDEKVEAEYQFIRDNTCVVLWIVRYE